MGRGKKTLVNGDEPEEGEFGRKSVTNMERLQLGTDLKQYSCG